MAEGQRPNVEESIKVRQVTDFQASWTEQGRGESGVFTYQLILDNGADEYVLQPEVSDAKAILRLLKAAGPVFFDLDRKILIPNEILHSSD
jgi:hypothetical protein